MNTDKNAAIALEGIGKCFRIYSNPQDRFKQAVRDRFGSWVGLQQKDTLYKEYWAVHDVSFNVHPGEAVGILGRNGAGKSTLLQIIAGTLAPTTGTVETSGRITALLELGSGFNPEFTGIENVLHNGQILGMRRNEIEERLDDILSFADIGDFVNQPVKTYSSGMMMRLAFAVQTAMSPNILIVDEALSVGDMFFQAKCMMRINRLLDEGVALLFVSHDIGSVRQLCKRAVLLDGGRVLEAGAAALVSDHYVRLQLQDRNQATQLQQSLTQVGDSDEVDETQFDQDQALPSVPEVNTIAHLDEGREVFEQRSFVNRVGNGDGRVINLVMLRNGEPCHDFEFGDEAVIRMVIYAEKTLKNLNASIKIRTLQGSDVVFLDTRLQGEINRTYQKGKVYCLDWTVDLPLLHGNYGLGCGLAHPPQIIGGDWIFLDIIPHGYEFRVGPRREGMIDGFVTLPAKLVIHDMVER